MIIKKLTVNSTAFPEVLRQLPQPPRQLFVTGFPLSELLAKPRVAIVGSRKPTPYGKQVTADLTRRLAEEGIVIVSGLAIGIDGLAHRTALEAGGQALAVLPSPLDSVVPATNRALGRQILEQGGTLVSEYSSGSAVYKQHFVARNRLVAALADAVLIPEAAEKSGSLHTARFALEQGKDVLAVPGNINSAASAGCNNLIKRGAASVTDYTDVLHALGIATPKPAMRRPTGQNTYEQAVLDLLASGVSEGAQLLQQSRLDVSHFNQTLTMLEIRGLVRPLGSDQWAIC